VVFRLLFIFVQFVLKICTFRFGDYNYETFSGLILEKYFRAKLIESKQFSDIGNYWNRKGENEIDIIAVRACLKRTQMTQNTQIYANKTNNKFCNTLIMNKIKLVLICDFCVICVQKNF